jgi:hypothetical protein
MSVILDLYFYEIETNSVICFFIPFLFCAPIGFISSISEWLCGTGCCLDEIPES